MPKKKKTELESDIVGCLDFALRHSNHFSGVSGQLDDMSIMFFNDDNIRCELKLRAEITKIDESEYIAPWAGSAEETEEFLKLAELYMSGDPNVMRADDPGNLALGLIRELPTGRGIMFRARLDQIKDRLDWQRFDKISKNKITKEGTKS